MTPVNIMTLINVWLIEDDPFARDMMIAFMARDWRTKVVKSTHAYEDSLAFMVEAERQRIDCVLIDMEVTGASSSWPYLLAHELRKALPNMQIIATCTMVTDELLDGIAHGYFNGVLSKIDIHYAIASAISKNQPQCWLTTQSVWNRVKGKAVHTGHKEVSVLNYEFAPELEKEFVELVRMASIYSLASADVADELQYSSGYVRRLISMVYHKLHLDMNSVDWDLIAEYLVDDALTNRLYDLYVERPKAAQPMLAFYLLTAVQSVRNHSWV